MKVAFYKGRKRLFNRMTSWWLRGPYSHVELVLGYDQAGQAICASSSMMDGGVRVKHMTLKPEHWDLAGVDASEQYAWDWLHQHEGAGYDYLGLLGFVARAVGHDQRKFVCSEAVAEMLGIPDGWRFDPCSLYAVVSYSHKCTNANESVSGNLIEEYERPG